MHILDPDAHHQCAPFLITFSGWAAGLSSLPDAAEREARLALIDTIGCIVAATDEPQTSRSLAAIRSGQMSGPSRSLVAEDPLPASAAAFLNGVAAHALDFDDYEIPGSTHPSAPIVSALLAVSATRRVTLVQVTRAYASGYEAITRLGEALGYGHYERGWHATSTLGPIGAAAAVANLAGLSADATAAALSLGATMAAGLKLQFGSDCKAIHAGLAARAGVEASMLAAAGITASPNIMEGPHGFLALFGTTDSPGFTAVLPRIGEPPALIQHPILRKPWPSCAYTHRAIEAALAIAARPGFASMQVAKADLRIAEPFLRVAGFTDPASPNEARFSACYCVAAALADGEIGPGSFSPEAIVRPDLRALMARVGTTPYALAPGLGDMSPAAPDTLTVCMSDGSVIEQTVAEVAGGTERPMDAGAILAKFASCGGDRSAAERMLSDSGATRFHW